MLVIGIKGSVDSNRKRSDEQQVILHNKDNVRLDNIDEDNVQQATNEGSLQSGVFQSQDGTRLQDNYRNHPAGLDILSDGQRISVKDLPVGSDNDRTIGAVTTRMVDSIRSGQGLLTTLVPKLGNIPTSVVRLAAPDNSWGAFFRKRGTKVNAYTYKTLINEPRICYDDLHGNPRPPPKLLLVITTSPDNKPQRQLVRETWGRTPTYHKPDIQAVFLVASIS